MTIDEQNQIILHWYPIIEKIGLSYQDKLPIHMIQDMTQDVTEWMIQNVRNDEFVRNYSNDYIKIKIKRKFQTKYKILQKQENILSFSDTEIIYTDNALFDHLHNEMIVCDLINRMQKCYTYSDRNLKMLFDVYHQNYTMTQIGKYHNISNKRVSQIVNKMLRSLKRICFLRVIPQEDKELFTPIGHYAYGYYDSHEYRKEKK